MGLKKSFPYLGSKSRILNMLLDITKNSDAKFLVELFGGSCVYTINNTKYPRCLNEINGDITNLFTVISNNLDELLDKFEWNICSRLLYDNIRKSKPKNNIDKAYRFLYLIIYGYRGRFSNDNYNSFGTSKTRKPTSKDHIINIIKDIYEGIKDVYIENQSYEVIISKYDDEHVLFFIDPPYITSNTVSTKYYIHNMDNIDDQTTLKNNISNISGKFILTVPDNQFYRDLYDEYNIFDTNVNYSLHKNDRERKTSELIITNFDISLNIHKIF